MFSYDRYGNRNFVTGTGQTTTIPSGCSTAVCNPSFNTANNRFASGQTWAYDSAGNVTTDANSQTFTYDAEIKQVKVQSGSQVIGEYSYDGDGRRVKKVVPATGESTVFIYDAAGKLVAEYSTIVASQQNAKVAYLTGDHLGSPRVNNDRDGNVAARHDYQPFGEEIATSQRAEGVGYPPNGDTVRKKFTGYEHDEETELNFAQARYQRSTLGRFTSPDPLMASASRVEPQSFNRYVYVTNNPLNLIDPSGMVDDLPPTTGGIIIPKPCIPGSPVRCNPVDLGTVTVSGSDTFVVPLETTNTTVSGEIQTRPPITFGLHGPGRNASPPVTTTGPGTAANFMRAVLASTAARAAAAIGLIITASAPPGGSSCQVATGDMWCGRRPPRRTPLFRAVGTAELADITANGGRFKLLSGGMEVKSFSLTPNGAVSYANQATARGGSLDNGPYTLVGTSIPTFLILPDMEAMVDRGIPAVMVPGPLLPSLAPARILGPIPTRPR